MAKISAKLVKELREKTGAGMMDCKKALVENDGDLQAATDYLLKKGIAKAAKKAGRTAAEGLVGISISEDFSQGVLVEVNCETDFVARNENFQSFVQEVADFALAQNIDSIDALKAASLDSGKSVEEWTKEQTANIGENIQLRRVTRFDAGSGNVVGSYTHAGSQIGVLVQVNVDGADTEKANEFARNVAMHVAASAPQFTSVDDIDASARDKQREILTAQALDSGKPANIVEKMVEGRIRKWQGEITLLEQPYVKDPDMKVSKYQKQTGGVSIASFIRYQVGEGIEKAASNLAEEVAALSGN